MTEKKITICGKEVSICYCAATENGFEQITKKPISIFVPTLGKNDKGETIITKPAEALTGDWMFLGIAGILTAYIHMNQEPPIDTNQVPFDATPEEVSSLITSIVELRGKWYQVPEIIPKDEPKADDEEKPKN